MDEITTTPNAETPDQTPTFGVVNPPRKRKRRSLVSKLSTVTGGRRTYYSNRLAQEKDPAVRKALVKKIKRLEAKHQLIKRLGESSFDDYYKRFKDVTPL